MAQRKADLQRLANLEALLSCCSRAWTGHFKGRWLDEKASKLSLVSGDTEGISPKFRLRDGESAGLGFGRLSAHAECSFSFVAMEGVVVFVGAMFCSGCNSHGEPNTKMLLFLNKERRATYILTSSDRRLNLDVKSTQGSWW